MSVFLSQKNRSWTKLSNVRLPSGENFLTARAVEIKKGEFLLLCGGGMNLKSYPKGGKSVLYHIKNGQIAQIDLPGLNGLLPVKDVAWADLDGNGHQDMILVGEWSSPMIFFQTSFLTFEKFDLGGDFNTARKKLTALIETFHEEYILNKDNLPIFQVGNYLKDDIRFIESKIRLFQCLITNEETQSNIYNSIENLWFNIKNELING
jgi:hypothetical protein